MKSDHMKKMALGELTGESKTAEGMIGTSLGDGGVWSVAEEGDSTCPAY